MTTAEAMALAVLKGDIIAARQLADVLLEQYSQGHFEVPPLKIITDHSRVRVVLYLKDNFQAVDVIELSTIIRDWLSPNNTNSPALSLIGVDRMEIYEVKG